MKKNNEGFSLVGVLVAVALMGAVAMGVMQITKNLQFVQKSATNTQDEIELQSLIRMILDNENFCRISLAGEDPSTTPVTFEKKNIDQPLSGEGLNVELWLSNQQGTIRTTKKLSGTDSSVKKYGQLEIISMKLTTNNGVGFNYTISPGHVDIGQLWVSFDKKINNKIRKDLVKLDVSLEMKTDAAGITTILSCSRVTSAPSTTSNFKTTLAIHSQTTTVPSCPAGWNSLWSGYSFVTFGGASGYTWGTDLGKSGSCLKQFRPMPFSECNGPNGCDFYTGGDFSYWLSTSTSDSGWTSMPAVVSQVGRCSVCEGDSPLLVLHSQQTTIPACPSSNWVKLWDGYSFLISSGSGGVSSGQDLSSPGSCLIEFRPMPFLECNGPNGCDFYTGGDFSFWLSTMTSDSGWTAMPAVRSQISRCSVCAYVQ